MKVALVIVALLSTAAAPAAAQEEVRLGIRGYVDEKVNIAIDELSPVNPVAREVAEVLGFDLDFSLRFNVLEGNPGVIRASGPGPDYESWAIFGTEYLVTGTVSSISDDSDSAWPRRRANRARSMASWTTRPAHMWRVPSCFST